MCEEKNITLSELNNILAFDKDKNGILALTAKNVALTNFIIKHDSNYRPLDDNDDSISQTIRKYGKTNNYEEILKIVKIIDNSNSTHQASMGRKGGNKGRESTAAYISSISKTDFYVRLNDGDPNLVNDIAANAIDDRYTFRFASKYCTYVARALFEDEKKDNYSIFDKVICDILPYYAWGYLGIKRTKWGIKRFYTGKYKEYRDLIDAIRFSAAKLCTREGIEENKPITRMDFDHLLWYYYKGDNPQIKNAIKLVGDETSRLS